MYTCILLIRNVIARRDSSAIILSPLNRIFRYEEINMWSCGLPNNNINFSVKVDGQCAESIATYAKNLSMN